MESNNFQTAEMILLSLASNPAIIGKGSALGDEVDEGVMNRLVHLATHAASQLVGIKTMSAEAVEKSNPNPIPATGVDLKKPYDGYQPAPPAPAVAAPAAPVIEPTPIIQFGAPKEATLLQVLGDRIRKLAADYDETRDSELGADIKTAHGEGGIDDAQKQDLFNLYKELVSPIKQAIKQAKSTVEPVTNTN